VKKSSTVFQLFPKLPFSYFCCFYLSRNRRFAGSYPLTNSYAIFPGPFCYFPSVTLFAIPHWKFTPILAINLPIIRHPSRCRKSIDFPSPSVFFSFTPEQCCPSHPSSVHFFQERKGLFSFWVADCSVSGTFVFLHLTSRFSTNLRPTYFFLLLSSDSSRYP